MITITIPEWLGWLVGLWLALVVANLALTAYLLILKGRREKAEKRLAELMGQRHEARRT